MSVIKCLWHGIHSNCELSTYNNIKSYFYQQFFFSHTRVHCVRISSLSIDNNNIITMQCMLSANWHFRCQYTIRLIINIIVDVERCGFCKYHSFGIICFVRIGITLITESCSSNQSSHLHYIIIFSIFHSNLISNEPLSSPSHYMQVKSINSHQ